MSVKRAWSDKRIEDVLANLLRAGVGFSAFVVFCGAVLYLFRHGHASADYRAFQGEPPTFAVSRASCATRWP